jgi:hypothetical protein
LISRVARKLAEDPAIGRGRLAKELGISEYAARGAMTGARALTAPSNGHRALVPDVPPGQ